MKLLLITLLSALILTSIPAAADRSDRSDRYYSFEDYYYGESKSHRPNGLKRKHQLVRHPIKHKHSVKRSQLDWALIIELSHLSGFSISHVEIVFDQYQGQGLGIVAFKLGVSRSSSAYRRITSVPNYRPWFKRYNQFDNVRSIDRVTLDRFSRR